MPWGGVQAGSLEASGIPAKAPPTVLPSCKDCAAPRRVKVGGGCEALAGGHRGGREGGRGRGLPHVCAGAQAPAGAAGEETAGGMAPSAGRHSGLDGLARPAGLSHMRLELETQAPGLEHERAHS